MIYKPFEGGKHCFVMPYDNQALKVFNYIDTKDWKDINWGDQPKENMPNMSVSLQDATIIQNICWLYGLAPRVYKIVKTQFGAAKHWAQVTDYVVGKGTQDEAMNVYKEVKKLGKKYGFANEKDDVSPDDVLENMLVDFNTFHFVDKEKLKNKYVDYARYGKIYYHNVDEFGLNNSPRKNDERIEWLAFDKIDFYNKSYVDLGSAGGYFVRYAKQQGASQAVGYDVGGKGSKDPVKGAYIASFITGQHDVDFYDLNLELSYPPIETDIASFLSMNYHIGIPDWLAQYRFLIFEDNSKDRDAEATLKKMFKSVERVGTSLDHGDKPIYWCKQ